MGFFRAARQFNAIVGSRINFPSTAEAQWICEQARYSPDLGYLEQKEFQLLFCPDDTKLGHSRYSLIEEGCAVATAYTTRQYEFWRLDAGNDEITIPMEILKQGGPRINYFPPPLKIKGELHVIRTHQFAGLDTYKRNTVQFRRKRVNVIVPFREGKYLTNDELCPTEKLPKELQQTKHFILSDERVEIVRAWMYVGLNSYWDNLFDGGWRGFKPVNYYESKRPWLKEYYDYPKRSFKSD